MAEQGKKHTPIAKMTLNASLMALDQTALVKSTM